MADEKIQGESGEESDVSSSAVEDFANEFIDSFDSDADGYDPPQAGNQGKPTQDEGDGAAPVETPAADDQGDGEGDEGTIDLNQLLPKQDETPGTPEPRLYTIPDLPEYGQLRGQKATIEQLEEAGLLEKVFTREHQEIHFQPLYQKLKAEFDERLAAEIAKVRPAQPEPAQAQPQSSMTPEQFAAQLEGQLIPELTQIAQSGAFEEDFLRVYPKVAAHIENRFRSGGMGLFGTIQQVSKLTERINQISEHVGMQVTTDARASAEQVLEGKIDVLAEQIPALANDVVRKSFREWASAEDNMLTDKLATKDVNEITTDELRGAFAAFVAVTGNGVRRQRAGRAGANMAGSGASSSRGTGSTTTPHRSSVETFEQEYIESQGV